MRTLLQLFVISLIFHLCFAPPVKEGTKENNQTKPEEGIENYMEYHRYLSEVVQALESDPEFKEKLQKAPEEEIRSGNIANQLEFVSHHVRTKLDEIKRVELDRLKELVEKKQRLQNGLDSHQHLDHSNPHTFEIEDLKKLIAKTQQDLAEADKARKEEFKNYELQKEYEKQVKLNSTNGDERAKLEREFKEKEEKHKQHEKLHEPGHKAQLEEVWQEQDNMQQEFDPKTFFLLHDMDSNNLWDENEVKALFLKELDKMYQAGAPEDDIRERIEEMERMRETVFKEVDTNRDGFIDYNEFIAQTKRQDFNEDHGWNGLDEQKPYTNEELEEYIAKHQQFQQHPPPVQYQGHNLPPQAQFHPGQVPQGQIQDLNSNSIHQNNYPNQAYQQQHPNPGYQQPNQVYQQQQNQGQYQQNPNQQYNQGQQQQPNQHIPPSNNVPQPNQYNPSINNVPQPNANIQQPPNNQAQQPQQINNQNNNNLNPVVKQI